MLEICVDFFDVVVVGFVVGGMVVLNLFVYGLTFFMGGDSSDLIFIFNALFNFSFLFGGIL